MISPSIMLTSGTSPPSGRKLECIAFTAPHEAAVVMVANSALMAMPKRTSLPSQLPAARPGSMAESNGLPPASAP